MILFFCRTSIKAFLDTNKNEILIVQLDMGDGTSADLRTALQHSGLLDYVYRSSEQYAIRDWPTMQELIDTNERLLLFAAGDGMRSCPPVDCEDGIMHTYDHFAMTDGTDTTTCDATLSGDVYVAYFMMNHFNKNKVSIPSAKNSAEMNSYSNLEARFEDCRGKRQPNLLAVDFWDTGDVLDFVENENKGDYEFDVAGEGGGEENRAEVDVEEEDAEVVEKVEEEEENVVEEEKEGDEKVEEGDAVEENTEKRRGLRLRGVNN